MSTFIGFLEELEHSHQTVVIPVGELTDLVARFGPRVRSMGRWNHATDGSLEIPIDIVAAAARSVGSAVLAEAVRQLKTPEEFTDLLRTSSAASRLIDQVAKLYLSQFEEKVLRYQESEDPAEVERLGSEISRELFGT